MNKRGMLKRSALLCLAMALAPAGAFAQASDALTRVKDTGVLRVGTETAFAPFDMIDETGKHVGLNVDVFEEIAKEMGVKLQWVTLPWEGVFPALESGQFELIAGPATITKPRVERYRFLTPIADATMGLLKAKGDTTITKPEDVAGKLAGAGKATAALAQIKAYSETLPKPVETREYVSFNEAYADLAAKRISVVVNSLPNISYVARKQPNVFEVVHPTFGAPAYFAFFGTQKPEDQPLLDAVNEALLKIKRDGRLATIQEKWFGVAFETPDIAPAPEF